MNRYPEARTIHLVMDNLNTHSRKALTETYGEQEGGWLWNRLTPHYTLVHGSWLNQAEIEISLFSRQCLGNPRIGDLPRLCQEVRAWNRRVNRQGLLIDWTSDGKAARKTFRYKTNGTNWSKH